MEASEEEIEAVKKVAPWDLEEVSNHTYMEYVNRLFRQLETNLV